MFYMVQIIFGAPNASQTACSNNTTLTYIELLITKRFREQDLVIFCTIAVFHSVHCAMAF